MAARHYHYIWKVELESPREELWSLLANTDLLNQEMGLPPVALVGFDVKSQEKLLEARAFGLTFKYRELPFDWQRPERYSVERKFESGPIRTTLIQARLKNSAPRGTSLQYDVFIEPRGFLGWLLVPIQIGWLSKNRFISLLKKWDKSLTRKSALFPASLKSSPRALKKASKIFSKMQRHGFEKELYKKFLSFLSQSGDSELSQIRPFHLADRWKMKREDLVRFCLYGTFEGLLEMQFRVLCPTCKGAKQISKHLIDIEETVHCDTCQIDFKSNIEEWVETTFRPHPSIREVENKTYCLGAPALTPHILFQKSLHSKKQEMHHFDLKPGLYRIRLLGKKSEGITVHITDGGSGTLGVDVLEDSCRRSKPGEIYASKLQVTLQNLSSSVQVVVFERVEKNSGLFMVADLLFYPEFRDLFSAEVFKRDSHYSVGQMTVVFTDLRGSTDMYREMGDAKAFQQVLAHFKVIEDCIRKHQGVLIKNMGDAVMIVFKKPIDALKAMLEAQEELASGWNERRSFHLRVGIHTGICLAVNLNNRIDYFGNVINMAARLEPQSDGKTIVLSQEAFSDPEIEAFVNQTGGNSGGAVVAEAVEVTLKGFSNDHYQIWKIARKNLLGTRTFEKVG